MKATNAFVAVFDVLGFKQLRSQVGTESLASRYERLLEEAETEAGKHALSDSNPYLRYHLSDKFDLPPTDYPKVRLIEVRVLSDTVVAFTSNVSGPALLALIDFSIALVASSLRLQLPLRGAISFGDLIVRPDSTLIIGNALERAYLLEQQQVWAGCILEENYFFKINKVGKQETSMSEAFAGFFQRFPPMDDQWIAPKIFACDVPLQKRSLVTGDRYFSQSRLVVNWAHHVEPCLLERAFPEPQTNHARLIKANTIRFKKTAESIYLKREGRRMEKMLLDLFGYSCGLKRYL